MAGITSDDIKAKAGELGFDLCGVAAAGDHAELGFFRDWIARGFAGEMGYLERTAGRRSDVRCVLPSARTVIVTATVYNTDRPYSTACRDPGRAHVARYAWGDDYHDVIGPRLDALLGWMRGASPEPFEARAYVDTGPVQERVYARHAGIGWIGKNTCVINADLGSWLFLAEIVCSLPLEPDTPAFDQCGTCTLCIEACPTGALRAPGVLDSTRCISYQTIELKGDIPQAAHAGIGLHVYGCDVCQDVCPWNQVAAVSDDRAWQPRPVWDGADVSALWAMSDADLRVAMRGSAMRRAKVAGFRRNLAIARRNVPTLAPSREA
jgi:epoxyqueuosine reductase